MGFDGTLSRLWFAKHSDASGAIALVFMVIACGFSWQGAAVGCAFLWSVALAVHPYRQEALWHHQDAGKPERTSSIAATFIGVLLRWDNPAFTPMRARGSFFLTPRELYWRCSAARCSTRQRDPLIIAMSSGGGLPAVCCTQAQPCFRFAIKDVVVWVVSGASSLRALLLSPFPPNVCGRCTFWG